MSIFEKSTFIFGGTFDPPHLGHVTLVQELLTQLKPKKLHLLPSATPAQKTQTTSFEHRLKLCELSFKDLLNQYSDQLILDQRESNREMPSYTFDTLKEFIAEGHIPVFVMGTDQWLNLPTWYRYPEILTLCHWLIALRRPRGSEEYQRGVQLLTANSELRSTPFTTQAPELSSSSIRAKIGSQMALDVSEYLHPDVYKYLSAHHLYANERGL
jgi:nicotinate (nicotinamide) nucleotide adenylyltransferase